MFLCTVADLQPSAQEQMPLEESGNMVASCFTLEINEFRCYEAKIEESEKAGSRWESNPGHLSIHRGL